MPQTFIFDCIAALFIFFSAGFYFRRLGCWIILVITILCILLVFLGAFVQSFSRSVSPQTQDINIAVFPYGSIATIFFPNSNSFDFVFWVIALPFIIYGIGACIAYSSKKRWRNLAIYLAAVAIIHALAAMYEYHEWTLHG